MEKEMNLVYIYDGTLEGFLCCVYESYARKQIPTSICEEQEQVLLFEQTEWVKTDLRHAEKVYESIARKICPEAQDFIKEAFLTTMAQKEILMYRFIRMGYKIGRGIFDYLTDDTVGALTKAVRNLKREAHLLMGFSRFVSYDGVLVSCISPKNKVLPLLADHFADRFPDETFMIYDKKHYMGVIHKPGETVLTSVRGLSLPPIEDAEKAYQTLWKCFQRTIAIEERYNPKCQMNHMPKRFWRDMTEFAE